MEKLNWYETGLSFDISPNHYYILRVRAESLEEKGNVATVQCRFSWSSRTVDIELPIISGKEEDFACPGKWLERYLILKAGVMEHGVSLFCSDEKCMVKAQLDSWAVELRNGQNETFGKKIRALLTRARASRVVVHGREWSVFQGINELPEVTDELFPADKNSPAPLPAHIVEAVPRHNLQIVCLGDRLLSESLSQSCAAWPCEHYHGPLNGGEALDAVFIQERSSLLQSSAATEQLRKAAYADCPVYTVRDTGNGGIGVKNARVSESIEYYGYEADFLNIVPSRRTHALGRVAVPCASDLYQFAAFQDVADGFLKAGYELSVFESLYEHKARVTWERFDSSAHVAVHGRLSFEEQIKEFRNCAFVLLCGYSLRNASDILTVACAALMSGSIPIIIGSRFSAFEFLDSFFSFENCFSWVRGLDTLTFQRVWLGKYRAFMRRLGNSSIRHDLFAEIAGIRLTGSPSAAAEILCVSKRPENVDLIAQNILRQSYDNLAVHLIWNVDEQDYAYCRQKSLEMGLRNLRVSHIDSQYNIGACLNHGIQSSEARYWFKMDDDDYYGKYYIEDMMYYYNIGKFDAVFKPAFFVSFDDNTLWYRKETKYRHLIKVKNEYGCGATLSGVTSILPFSTLKRNSCDSAWEDELKVNKANIFIGDSFNYCTFRGDVKAHTWQISDEILKKISTHIGMFSEEYLDAE